MYWLIFFVSSVFSFNFLERVAGPAPILLVDLKFFVGDTVENAAVGFSPVLAGAHICLEVEVLTITLSLSINFLVLSGGSVISPQGSMVMGGCRLLLHCRQIQARGLAPLILTDRGAPQWLKATSPLLEAMAVTGQATGTPLITSITTADFTSSPGHHNPKQTQCGLLFTSLDQVFRSNHSPSRSFT